MYKSCGRCGKIHDVNYKCNVGRVYTAVNIKEDFYQTFKGAIFPILKAFEAELNKIEKGDLELSKTL